jgi:hypothetical protein
MKMDLKNIDSAFVKKLLEENQRYRMALVTIATCEVPYAPITDHSVIQFYEKTAQEALESK